MRTGGTPNLGNPQSSRNSGSPPQVVAQWLRLKFMIWKRPFRSGLLQVRVQPRPPGETTTSNHQDLFFVRYVTFMLWSKKTLVFFSDFLAFFCKTWIVTYIHWRAIEGPLKSCSTYLYPWKLPGSCSWCTRAKSQPSVSHLRDLDVQKHRFRAFQKNI